MNKFKMTLIASSVVASLSAFSVPTYAADSGVTVSGSAAVVSDYRWRGLSQSFKKPAVQVGIDLGLPAGFYAGFWGSSISGIEYPDTASLETDWFGGYNYKLNDDVSFDVGGIYVYYPQASGNANINTTEFHIAGTYKWLTLQYNVDASKYYGLEGSKGSSYIQLDGSFPVTDALSLDAHVGHQKIKGDANSDLSYTDWSLGATYTFPQDWAVSLAYIDTNAKEALYTITSASGDSKNIAGPTAVLSVSKSF